MFRNHYAKLFQQVIGGYEYHADQSWKADSNSGNLQGPIKTIAAADTTGADLQVFLCKDTSFYGVIGLAWVGTMCKGWAGYNAGVNEKRQNVLATSEVNHYIIEVEFFLQCLTFRFLIRLWPTKWVITWECFMTLMKIMVVQEGLVTELVL